MSKSVKKILFVDNETNHQLYKPLDHWRPLFLHPYEVYHAPYEQPPSLDSFTHIILSGSLSSTLENKGWMKAEEELIRTAVCQGKVLLGNCFGHQLLAKALLGNNVVRKRDKPEIGWPAMELLFDDPLLGSLGDVINGFVLHFDEVQAVLDDQVNIILRSPECENLAFKLKNKPVWGIQPHFEIGIVQGFEVIDVVKGPGVPDKSVFLGSAEIAPRDSGSIVRMMKVFQNIEPDQDESVNN